MSYSVIFTCEHAGNEVPAKYQSLFTGQSEILQSHRGWDPGAWPLAHFLSHQMEAPLFGCMTTRLLIETNRSLDNPQLFSEFSSPLTQQTKDQLIRDIYKPFQWQVEMSVEKATKPVFHLSIHSFTPIWFGQERMVDIGILFDPLRNSEVSFSYQLTENLNNIFPKLKIQTNQPYQGTDDSFTSFLRRQYSDNEYIGIIIEVNQKFNTNLSLIEEGLAKSIMMSVTAYIN